MNQYSNHFDGTINFKYYLNTESIQNLKKWGVNVVRIGLETSQVNNEAIMQDYLDTIDLLVKNDIYIVSVLWTSEDEINTNTEIPKQYFEILSKKYSNTTNILYEIANEPGSTATWTTIKNYSNAIIPIIRNYSKDSIIIIPNPSWDSRPDLVNLAEICDKNNVMTSYHMYVGNGLTKEKVDYLQEAVNKNIPIFVTEWGTTLGNGNDGFYEDYSNAFIKFMETNSLSWCNFLITDMNFKVDMGEGKEEYSGIVQHNKWNNSLEEEILTESGKYIKKILQGTCISYNNKSYAIMMPRDDNYAFWQDEYRNKITSIEFNKSDTIPDNAIQQWDISLIIPNSVFAYIIEDEANIKSYKLFITSNNDINLPINCGSLFSNFSNVTNIYFNGVKCYNVTNFSYMFKDDISLLNIEGLNNLNTKNLTALYDIFSNCKNLKKINLENWDVSKVKEMINTFANCINLEEIKGIDNWDVSNTTVINSVFQNCQSINNLNLSNWKLKNVTSMSLCFWNMRNLENLYLNNAEFNLEILQTYREMITGINNSCNIFVKNLSVANFIYSVFNENNIVAHIYYGTEDNWTEYIN